jgi:hypothetical protein
VRRGGNPIVTAAEVLPQSLDLASLPMGVVFRRARSADLLGAVFSTRYHPVFAIENLTKVFRPQDGFMPMLQGEQPGCMFEFPNVARPRLKANRLDEFGVDF